MEWRNEAACSRENAELFFPVGNDGPPERQTDAAKAVCRRCPVRTPCLEHAPTAGEDAGVWGGQDEAERRDLLRSGRRRLTSA